MNPTLALINRSTGYTADMGMNTGQVYQTGDFATDMGVNNQAVADSQAAAGGGGGGGLTASQIAAQQAAAAETARINNLIRTLGLGQDNVRAGGEVSARDIGNTYDTKNRSFLTNMETGQNTINTGRATNALNLRRSMAQIAGGVRQGLRSGGVNLANMNALDSGAAEALARAWARVGNNQTTDVRGQAALKSGEIDTQQNTLNRQREDTLAEFGQYRDTETNRLGQKIGGELQGLTAQGEGRWNADMGIRDRIVGDAIARLNAIDANRAARLSGIRGLTPEEIEIRAQEMDRAGAAASPFATEDVVTQIGGTPGGGAPISQLPIFTRRRETRQAPVAVATA